MAGPGLDSSEPCDTVEVPVVAYDLRHAPSRHVRYGQSVFEVQERGGGVEVQGMKVDTLTVQTW